MITTTNPKQMTFDVNPESFDKWITRLDGNICDLEIKEEFGVDTLLNRKWVVTGTKYTAPKYEVTIQEVEA